MRILAGLDDHDDEIVPVEKSRQEEAPLIEENGINRTTDHRSEVVEAEEVIDVEEDVEIVEDNKDFICSVCNATYETKDEAELHFA